MGVEVKKLRGRQAQSETFSHEAGRRNFVITLTHNHLSHFPGWPR